MLSPLSKLLEARLGNYEFIEFIFRAGHLFVTENLQQFKWCWVDFLVESIHESLIAWHEILIDVVEELLYFLVADSREVVGVV
jgi:hypothetical protein